VQRGNASRRRAKQAKAKAKEAAMQDDAATDATQDDTAHGATQDDAAAPAPQAAMEETATTLQTASPGFNC
jgi:hypothetical protein